MPTPVPTENARSSLLALAVLVSAIAVAGSVWLSVGMNLKACPLCLYQRAFAMGAFAVLAIGWLGGQRGATAMALPLAVAGAGVCGFHLWLLNKGTLECPIGVMGIGTAPLQACAVLVLLNLVTLADIIRSRHLLGGVAGIVLGVAIGYGCIASAPPLPPAPKEPYKLPVNEDGCRPPYVAISST
jgi:disulfide bond formation protein DsbB